VLCDYRCCCCCLQVAKQEGEFVADLLLRNPFSSEVGTVQLEPKQQPFK
jgi:hypothetical protein